ncbi:MAG: hypothetical protein WBG90_14570 [Saonia sp.]
MDLLGTIAIMDITYSWIIAILFYFIASCQAIGHYSFKIAENFLSL